jgi:hypothetical protein
MGQSVMVERKLEMVATSILMFRFVLHLFHTLNDIVDFGEVV